MESSGCPHGMPKPSTCVDCMEEGNLEVPKWIRNDTRRMDSIYSGSPCRGKNCNRTIELGEPIVMWSKGDDVVWTHADCVMQ